MSTSDQSRTTANSQEGERYLVPTEDKVGAFLFGSAPRRRRTEGAALFLILAALSLYATKHVGFQLGWLIGASLSPIAQAIAPSIFGLLALLGVGIKVQEAFSKRRAYTTGWREKRREIWRAILTAGIIVVFCKYLPDGLSIGIASRTMPYTDAAELMSESWKKADHRTAAAICAFTVRAHLAGVPGPLYERFILDAVRPILDDRYADKLTRVEEALATMEAVFPKPAPTANEQGKQEPAEPAGEPKSE